MNFLEEDREKLHKIGVQTPLDLALIIPHKYEDYTLSTSLQEDHFATLEATIEDRHYHPKYMRLKLYAPRLNLRLNAILFHPRKYHYEKFTLSSTHFLYGKVNLHNDQWQMTQPQIIVQAGIILPKYKTRLQSKTVQALIKKYMTQECMREEGLDAKKWEILHRIHFPDRDFVQAFQKEGFDRTTLLFLKYLEIYNHLKKLSSKRVRFESIASLQGDATPFIKSLPFDLTDDQRSVIKEIQHDLKQPIAARRVIMGDVGSGKTMVIFASVMLARPYRSILMAPTTVLAAQIYEEAKKFLPKTLKITLVTNKSKKGEDLSEYDFIIGTHALLFRDLPDDIALVMVDEQHRFGTKQRSLIEKLVSQGEKRPHYLQFSATPIPRTLSMMQSQMIDISKIQQTPFPKDIDTLIIGKKSFHDLLAHIRSEIEKGNQIIIVYPLVQESETIEYQSIDEARGYWEKNFEKVFVTHGKDKEKEEVIAQFAKEGNILLATTLIEVGVSLPKLSTIILVAPERLGLATLHQLRGRVSRNGLKGYCFLFTHQPQSKRLKAFAQTTDGFEIAELDLAYRQSGDLLRGDIQSGKHFKWFDPVNDEKILRYAMEELRNSPL